MVSGQVPHKEISGQMNKKSSGSAFIMHKIALAAILILMAASACINRKDKTDHGKLVPEKTFVSILTDIYIANGLLSLPEIRYQFSGRDSVLNYMDIIESYGYSYETMNSTMNYYFVTKPKKLIRIYDQVIRKMTEEETAMQNEIMRKDEEQARRSINYNVYSYPDPDRLENPGASHNIAPPGTYTMTMSVTFYPDDQSFNPHFSAWFIDADSLETGIKRWLPTVKYVKDGQMHYIIYSGRIETSRPAVLKTILYEYENNITEWERHARIEVNSFTFISDPV
jgi:hypothetical protein